MKKAIKSFIPQNLLGVVGRYIWHYQQKKDYIYQIILDYRLVKRLSRIQSTDKSIKQIMLMYHVIEKGITMPNRRFGFGQKVVMSLMKEIDNHLVKYGNDNEQLEIAIGVLINYYYLHKQNDIYHFDELFERSLEEFINRHKGVAQIHQIETTKSQLFSDTLSSFDKFSNSRHSIRSFEGTVPMDKVLKAIKLAQNAPSACNRQSIRITVVDNHTIISKIFEYQKGNRGFGHLVDKLLIITTDMNYWDMSTRNGGYVDGGIYAMNLLYSLHYYNIASCPLNACFSVSEEKQIRLITNTPDCQKFVIMIAIGGTKDSFSINNSHRTNYEKVLRIID